MNAKPTSDLMLRLKALAEISAEPGAMTRLYLTPEHKRAVEQVSVWMREAGLSVHVDAVATVVGRYEGAVPDAPVLLLGSHIDTVRNAGIYDGNLGVLAAIEAVRRLNEAGERLPYAIEVLAFGDEEGVRFPVTLTSSRAVAGIFDPASLDATDDHGTRLKDALEAFGCDPAQINLIARDPARVAGYVEIHIEQGPVLEAENLPVGVVTAINGASRAIVEVKGVAGHAGTVPMALRHDAGTAAAEMVLAVERLAQDTAGLVGTVGQLQFQPGAVNVIPSDVRFTVDCRSADDGIREQAMATLRGQFEAIAARRHVTLRMDQFYAEPAATCSPAIMDGLERAIASLGVRPVRLPSGAGHDGLAMVSLCPIGMLFVRCKGGISHNPAESITEDDADAAVAVLLEFLRRFHPDRAG